MFRETVKLTMQFARPQTPLGIRNIGKKVCPLSRLSENHPLSTTGVGYGVLTYLRQS